MICRSPNMILAGFFVALLATACSGIPIKVDTGELGSKLAEAADKIDPIALKEIYRDAKDSRELVDRLKKALAGLEQSKAPSAESFEVTATCLDDDAGNATYRVLLARRVAREDGSLEWSAEETILTGTCTDNLSGSRTSARINKNTRGAGGLRRLRDRRRSGRVEV